MEKSVLLIEAFDTGSHKQMLDTLCEWLRGEAYTVRLPGKKWHWKARTSALAVAQMIPKEHNFRKLWSSSVLPLAELCGLRPDLIGLEKLLYVHENQLCYPVRNDRGERDYQYGYNQITSCLAANMVMFNSEFCLSSFLGAVPHFLSRIPDSRPNAMSIVDEIRSKAQVFYFPIQVPICQKSCKCGHSTNQLASSNHMARDKINPMSEGSQISSKSGKLKLSCNGSDEMSDACGSSSTVDRLQQCEDGSSSRVLRSCKDPTLQTHASIGSQDQCSTVELQDEAAASNEDFQNQVTSHNGELREDVRSINGRAADFQSARGGPTNIEACPDGHSPDSSPGVQQLAADQLTALQSEVRWYLPSGSPGSKHQPTDISQLRRDHQPVTRDCVDQQSSDQSVPERCKEAVPRKLRSVTSSEMIESNANPSVAVSDWSGITESLLFTLDSPESPHVSQAQTEHDPQPFIGAHAWRDGSPLHIVWPHRWEHDKNPESLFECMSELHRHGFDFRLSVIGDSTSDVPDVFDRSFPLLREHIVHWGYQPTRAAYEDVLRQSDVVLSTAKHEFYGVSMLEAVALGCYPLCPNRLVYPELYPQTYLYNTDRQLYKRLSRFCRNPHLVRTHTLQMEIKRFHSSVLFSKWMHVLRTDNHLPDAVS